jgi:hypothetical protein
MKTFLSCLAILFLGFGGPCHAQKLNVNARTVYHTDGTSTESVQDPFTREQKEVTYRGEGAQRVKIAERVYLLNERGIPVQGNVYDGRGNLVSRVQVMFDGLGRQSEQRMMNLAGEVYQRIVFEYDNKGKPLSPRSINYSNVQAPEMKTAPIDLTGSSQIPQRHLDRSQGDASGVPGNVPRLPEGAGQSGVLPPIGIGANGKVQGDANTAPAPLKKSFFGRLFGSKDKKEGN